MNQITQYIQLNNQNNKPRKSTDDIVVVDIETCPIQLSEYLELTTEKDKKEYLNAMDSRVVAIGVRYKGKSQTLMYKNERKLLRSFGLN